MPINSTIFGLSGLKLTQDEQAFFRDINPWGFILFARNIDTPQQVKALTQSLKDCVGRDALVFIDQEGGRVQRLRPPHWKNYPPGQTFYDLYKANPDIAQRALYLNMKLIANDLLKLGITANCAPVLDIPVSGADEIISDRAYGASPEPVVRLAHAAMAGLTAGGVAPVIKHIPGHGRATVDSHKALPRITTGIIELELTDFAPFNALSSAPMAMTAHAIYDAIDPDAPVTISRTAIQSFIRQRFGFDGILMSDDLDMKALSGTLQERTEQCLRAGCDVALQCSGELNSMIQVAKGSKSMGATTAIRAHIAENCTSDRPEFDRWSAEEEISTIFAQASA